MSRRVPAAVPDAVILIRLIVGGVFLAEGIQKFLFAAELGAGRFEKIGIPWPAISAPFVGAVETLGGALLLVGLLTRAAAAVLLIDISVAIVTTKIPILIGHALGPFTVSKLPRYGFWAAVHEARVDLSMWFGSLFLLIVGPGRLSVDASLRRDRQAPDG